MIKSGMPRLKLDVLKPLGLSDPSLLTQAYVYVNPRTQQEYDQLMQAYEAGGWYWGSWESKPDFKLLLPTSKNIWHEHGEDFCVDAGVTDSDFPGVTMFWYCNLTGLKDLHEYEPDLVEFISPIEFYERQPLVDRTDIKQVFEWFEKNKPNRTSASK